MRGPSPFVLATVAAFSASIAALSPLVPSAKGDLDRITADGVTEKGGSAAYARMLPRTGPDGILDASLLPPVADWASQPISNLYYLAGNAPTQGNGSPQYPFNTLTYALAHMAPGSALLLAPATYSGALSLPAERTVTLVGTGPSAYVSSFSVTAAGSSSATRLALVGLRVGTLSLAGGKVEVWLSHSTVGHLEGSASAVTVTRTDLGSAVGLSTLAHADVYTGYDTVPKAMSLVSAGSTARLSLPGSRPTVVVGTSTNAVAYLSDVANASNGVDTAVQGLQAADTALSGRVAAEEAARAAGDLALSNRLEDAFASLATQIGGVGTSWSGQLSLLNTAVGSLQSSLQADLQALRTKETNDVHALEQAIAAVQSACQAADAAMSTNIVALQASVSTFSANLSATVAAQVAPVADGRIEAKRPSIVSNAVDTADAHISVLREELRTTINGLIAALGSSTSLTNTYNIALPAPLP